MLLGPATLVRQQWASAVVTGHQLDSLGLPRRAGRWWARGRRSWVRPLAADSFQLAQPLLDTVAAFGGRQPGALRRYRGWYYLSTPDPAQPGRWQVTRLAIAGLRLRWQQFNPDTLRLRALDTSAVHLRREPPRLLFTLGPRSHQAVRQVSGYAGLWQPLGSYERRAER